MLRCKSVTEKLSSIDAFKGMSSADEQASVQSWASQQKENALLSLKQPWVSDIDVILGIVQEYGTSWFYAKFVASQPSSMSVSNVFFRIFPNIVKEDSMYTFWAAFTRRLYAVKETLPVGTEDNLDTVPSCPADAFVDKVFEVAVQLWEVKIAVPQPQASYWRGPPKIDKNLPNPQQVMRILDIIDLCLSTNHVDSCRPLFVLIFNVKPPSPATFKSMYRSLTSALRKYLDQKNLSICDAPFAEIAQVLVGSYLHGVLGAKPNPVNLRKVGCGCENCQKVDSFVQNAEPETVTLHINQVPKRHLLTYLHMARDLVDYKIIERGRPQPLVVSRSVGLKAVRNWPKKQANARAFLASVGDDDVIGKLVGSRYADVLRAVDGSRQFALPMHQPTSMDVDASGGDTQSQSTNGVAGKKRKQPAVIEGEVIDLRSD